MIPTWAPQTHHATLIRTVAAHGLAGSLLHFPDEPLAPGEFDQLLHDARSQRLTGLLWAAVQSGMLPVTDEQVERTEWLHVETLAGVLSLERFMLDTVGELDRAGIPVRALKGPVLAHLDYPEPAWRTFGDVDLLVQGDDFDRATEVIIARGHRRRHPEPRPGFDRRFSKGTSFLTEDGLELDLHRTFTMGPLGVRLRLDELWARSEAFRMGGRQLHALPAEERFVHACYHAVLGEATPRLVPLRDIAQLALTRSLDLERVHHLIRTSGGEAVVSRAVRHAWHDLRIADVLSLSAWAEAYRTDPRQAAELAVYGSHSSYARKSVASIRALPTWHDKASFVHALVLPDRSYLGTRHSGHLGRLRTGLAQTRNRRRAP